MCKDFALLLRILGHLSSPDLLHISLHLLWDLLLPTAWDFMGDLPITVSKPQAPLALQIPAAMRATGHRLLIRMAPQLTLLRTLPCRGSSLVLLAGSSFLDTAMVWGAVSDPEDMEAEVIDILSKSTTAQARIVETMSHSCTEPRFFNK
jgi:hypothetical protein